MSNTALEQTHELLRRRYMAGQQILIQGGVRSPEDKGDLPGEHFTFARFLDHVEGRAKYGVHVVDQNDTVCFAIFDVDVVPRNLPDAELVPALRRLLPTAIAIRRALLDMGLGEDQILSEFSGVGIHLWLFFEPAVPAARAHALLRRAMTLAGDPDVPFRPTLTEDGRGDTRGTVNLPLRMNRGFRSAFVPDLSTFDPTSYSQELDASLLVRVRPLDTQALSQIEEAMQHR